MSAKGKLYVIPIQISEGEILNVIPSGVIPKISTIRHFVVEKIKPARQFLRKIDRDFPIDESVFYELDKHNNYAFNDEVLVQLKNGQDFGLISEAGYPGVADPGSNMVALAHQNDIEVIPFVGPSSILMALAASGLNGQGFTFNGYLPVKDPERSKRINFIVQLISKTKFAQIFIETPYRNQMIFEDLLKQSPDGFKLCVAYDITGSDQKIVTRSVQDWKKAPFKFDKTPAVFVLGV